MVGMILAFLLSEVWVYFGSIKSHTDKLLGIRRRGLTVDAISQFMLAQGPSQAIVSLEWDSIWALNKKIIDPIAPRFWALVKDKKCVELRINRRSIRN